MNALKSTTVALGVAGALSACGQSVEGQPVAAPVTTETSTTTTAPEMPPETQSPLRPTEFPVEGKVCTRMPKLDDSRRGPQGATIFRFAVGTTCEMSVHDEPDPASPEIGKMNIDTDFTMECYQGIGDVMLHNSAVLVRFNVPDVSGQSRESRYGYVIDMDDAWSDPSRKPADTTLSDCEQSRWDPDGPQEPIRATGTK